MATVTWDILNCFLVNNTVGGQGGAIDATVHCRVMIIQSIFENNVAQLTSGVILLSQSSLLEVIDAKIYEQHCWDRSRSF